MNVFKRLFNKLDRIQNPEERTARVDARIRRFTAAANSRLIDWIVGYNKINADLKLDYVAMTLRARDLAKNNEFVLGLLRNLVRNVIGADGFILQSKCDDRERRSEIERLWREYQSRLGGFVTFDERQSGRDFDELILRTLFIDGEVFVHRAYDPESRFGYRYEIIDSLEVDPLYNIEDAGNGERVIMGVRIDGRGREIAYYIRRSQCDQYTTGDRIEVPAADVLHIFRKEFADQTRGFTPLSGVILDLNQLDAYKEAEVVHARMQACSMAIWEWNGQSTGDLLDEVDDKGEFLREMKPGIFQVAPKGYTAKQLAAQSPNNQFGTFWKNMLRGIANSLGISYNKAAGDYEAVNYSSLREATLEDRATFEELQRFVVENWKAFQFRDFIRALAMTEVIPVSAMDDCCRHRFYGRRFPWVDPAKEIAAKEKELDLFLTDPIAELEQRGLDPDEVFEHWTEWLAKVREHELPYRAAPPLPADNEPEPEDNANAD